MAPTSFFSPDSKIGTSQYKTGQFSSQQSNFVDVFKRYVDYPVITQNNAPHYYGAGTVS